MFYVYLLRSESTPSQVYTGFTEDLRQRLEEHNSGKSPHTRQYRPWAVETYLAFSNRSQAQASHLPTNDCALRPSSKQEAATKITSSPQTAPAYPQRTRPHPHLACRDCGCPPASAGCRVRCPDDWPCVAPDQ